MTDSEKLDLLLAEMQEMKTEMNDIKKEMNDIKKETNDIKKETNDIKTEMNGIKKEMNTKFDEVNKRLGKLEVEQAGITKELYMINRKISDTYGVALDALASTAENRKWLETGTASLI